MTMLFFCTGRSDTRQLVMLIVSVVIADGHVMFLRDMCCYIWVMGKHPHLSSPRGPHKICNRVVLQTLHTFK